MRAWYGPGPGSTKADYYVDFATSRGMFHLLTGIRQKRLMNSAFNLGNQPANAISAAARNRVKRLGTTLLGSEAAHIVRFESKFDEYLPTVGAISRIWA